MKPSKIFLYLLSAAAFLLFLYRGPLRALYRGGGDDFATPYIADIRLTHHQDPYACCGTFGNEWIASGGPLNLIPDLSGQHPVYPPVSLLMLTPFTWFHWRAALYIEVALATMGLLLVMLAYSRSIRNVDAGISLPLFFTFALLIAPLQTGITMGNIGILSFILSAAAFYASVQSKEVAAGVLLGLGICLKPNVAIPLFIFFLFTKHWRAISTSVACGAVILLCSTISLSSVGPSWRSHYRENVSFLFSPVGAASYQPRYADMVNLQNPLFAALHNVTLAEAGAWLITAILFVLWLRYGRDLVNLETMLASVSCVWLIGLLPVYQRGYNAGALILVLAWAFRAIEHRQAKLALYLFPAFFVPGFTLLYLHGFSPHSLPMESSGIYKAIVLCYQTWALIIVVLLQLSYLRSVRASSSLAV